MNKLSPKQLRLCEEYLVDLNGTQAAIRAVYSPRTAHTTANEILTKPYIQSHLANLRTIQSQRTEIEADRVVNEFGSIAFGSLKGLVEINDGKISITDSSKWTPEQWACVKDVKKTSEGISIAMHSKISALESLGKHLGMFGDLNMTMATLDKYGIAHPKYEDGSWKMKS